MPHQISTYSTHRSYKSQLPSSREHSPILKAHDAPFLRRRDVSSVSVLDSVGYWEATSSVANPCLHGGALSATPLAPLLGTPENHRQRKQPRTPHFHTIACSAKDVHTPNILSTQLSLETPLVILAEVIHQNSIPATRQGSNLGAKLGEAEAVGWHLELVRGAFPSTEWVPERP